MSVGRALALALSLWAAAEGQPAHPPLLTSPPLGVASTVNGYVLVSRVASLPGTHGGLDLSREGWSEPEEALALLGEGITQRLRALPLRLPDPNSYDAATAKMLLAGSDASTKFLALPGPFEEELLDELHTYRLHRRVNRGAHGEVWRAVRSDDPHSRMLILKRMLPGAMRSGLREVHFGQRTRGAPGVARFLDAFEAESKLWLVFVDEGRSLHTLLYTTLETESGVLMRPSVLWLRLRREPAGRLLTRRLVYEALSAVARCHREGITHRDLKPANLIVDLARSPALRLADFGSAIDERTTEPRHGLYPRGPSLDEETAGYQPPEAALGGAAVDPDHPTSYDLWSLGVIVLELLLGTPDVFQPSPKAEARRNANYERERRQGRTAAHGSANTGRQGGAGSQGMGGDGTEGGALAEERLRRAAALAEYCIRPAEPRSGALAPQGWPRLPGGSPSADAPCGIAEFVASAQRLDPLHRRGVPLDPELLDLAFRLLRWEPAERLSAAEALRHQAMQAAAATTSADYAKLITESDAEAPPGHGTRGAAAARRLDGGDGGAGALLPVRGSVGGGCVAEAVGCGAMGLAVTAAGSVDVDRAQSPER